MAGLLVVGCGKSTDHGVDLHPVSGSVQRDGQPLSGATVTFYTTPHDQQLSGVPIPKAVTDESGNYALRTFEPEDGAPAGDYAVTVRLIQTANNGGPLEERDLLDGAYSNPAKPAALITVSQGHNRLEPIVID